MKALINEQMATSWQLLQNNFTSEKSLWFAHSQPYLINSATFNNIGRFAILREINVTRDSNRKSTLRLIASDGYKTTLREHARRFFPDAVIHYCEITKIDSGIILTFETQNDLDRLIELISKLSTVELNSEILYELKNIILYNSNKEGIKKHSIPEYDAVYGER